MKYPIHVERSRYRGGDLRKRQKAAEYNRDAQVLEDAVNQMIREGGPRQFLYHEIARITQLPLERVRKIMFSVDCGHNGLTVSHGVGGEPAEFIKRWEAEEAKQRSAEPRSEY